MGPEKAQSPEFNLSGKVALVTGGTRDIGGGISFALSIGGADVVATHRDPHKSKRGEALIKRALINGGKITSLISDITDPMDREVVASEIEEKFGSLDILVLNASGPTRGVNVEGANGMIDAVLPLMRSGGKMDLSAPFTSKMDRSSPFTSKMDPSAPFSRKIILIQSVPGHFYPELAQKGVIPDYYKEIAKVKYEGELSLRQRALEFRLNGVGFHIVVPPEVRDTSNMRYFKRIDPDIDRKLEEMARLMKLRAKVTIEDVANAVFEIAAGRFSEEIRLFR